MSSRNASVAGRHDAAPSRPLLLRALQEMYQGPAWHGPSLRWALRGVRAAEATWRPAPNRNAIWDVVLHTAYARHRILLRLDVTPTTAFPRALRSGWWPRLPDELSDDAWRADLALLEDYQQRLLAAVSAASPTRLATRRRGKPWTLANEVLGIAQHDAYHAGQIQLVKRLMT